MEAASASPGGGPVRQPVVDIRPRTSQALGVAMVAAAVVALGSAVHDGLDATLQYAAPSALFGLVGWAAFFEPGVTISDGGVLIRNTLRSIEIPWPAVESIEGRYGLQLRTAYGAFTAWGAGAPRGRTRMKHPDSDVADEVQRRLDQLRAAGYLEGAQLEWARPRVTWHRPLLITLAVLAILSAVLPFVV